METYKDMFSQKAARQLEAKLYISGQSVPAVMVNIVCNTLYFTYPEVLIERLYKIIQNEVEEIFLLMKPLALTQRSAPSE